MKQTFEIKVVLSPRYNETVSLNVQNAIVKGTFEEFSFFFVFLSHGQNLSKSILYKKVLILSP